MCVDLEIGTMPKHGSNDYPFGLCSLNGPIIYAMCIHICLVMDVMLWHIVFFLSYAIENVFIVVETLMTNQCKGETLKL
jgi:hypothetical protein